MAYLNCHKGYMKKLEEIRNENSNIMQDKEHQTTRELQVDNYYRSISGKNRRPFLSLDGYDSGY